MRVKERGKHKKIIDRARDTRELSKKRDFFCRSSYFNLPTTCMSPDTIIVLKCGASAETVKNQQKKEKYCDFISMKAYHVCG